MNKDVITSPTNQRIKDLVRLKDRKGEQAESAFLIEGMREIERALQCGFVLEQIYVCPKLSNKLPSADFTKVSESAGEETEISEEAYNKVATREGGDGLLAVCKTKIFNLSDLTQHVSQKTPLIVAVEELEKPGNLGAILRSADAAKVDAVVVLGHSVDVWNRHVIRSSLGGVFSVPVISLSNQDFFEWCKQHKVTTFAAALDERSKSLFDANLDGPSSIILGREATGLSEFWFQNASHLVMIPMQGICDSLNVSVAAGICMFEAVRQRRLL